MSTEVPTGEYPDGTYINYCDDDFCVVQLKLTGGKYAADAEGFRAYIGNNRLHLSIATCLDVDMHILEVNFY